MLRTMKSFMRSSIIRRFCLTARRDMGVVENVFASSITALASSYIRRRSCLETTFGSTLSTKYAIRWSSFIAGPDKALTASTPTPIIATSKNNCPL